MSDNETCHAGVPYAKFEGMAFDTRPCFKRDRDEPMRPGCELCQFPTPEELDAAEKEMAERFARTGAARMAIVEHLGGPWKRGTKSASGEIPCPTCGGKLRFSRSGYNGHIHAACSTENCCAWME